jgi:hypothetical protein
MAKEQDFPALDRESRRAHERKFAGSFSVVLTRSDPQAGQEKAVIISTGFEDQAQAEGFIREQTEPFGGELSVMPDTASREYCDEENGYKRAAARHRRVL